MRNSKQYPFLDGNGRVGRLLITFLLCEKRILQRPLLYLSHYFKKNRSEYYDRLQAIRDWGDWEGWLKFFLHGTYEVAQEATSTARRIVTLREQHRELITQKMGRAAAKGLILLESLYINPVVTVRSVEKVTKTSYANANTLARQFLEMGLLKEITGRQRNRRFLYGLYVALFEDDN